MTSKARKNTENIDFIGQMELLSSQSQSKVDTVLKMLRHEPFHEQQKSLDLKTMQSQISQNMQTNFKLKDAYDLKGEIWKE